MIRILDSFVADKIAAGEVIERPLSIIKELVENSLDASASKIVIEIRNGGKSYIRVTDDGTGIPADEVGLAFERHATGKIATLSDLDRIETLGFRGEALASIAAVSRLTMYTRAEGEQAGTKAVLHGGRMISKDAAGCNRGTTIVCEDVFYNTPARRKFMKSDAAEASVIIDLIQRMAVCYADVSFRLINNGNIILSTSGSGSKREAIERVFTTSEYRSLIEVRNDKVHGFISDPGVTKNTRRGQVFFVNGRVISSKAIEKGIEKGYGDRIFSGYPICILFITEDPLNLDVNIHPNKREVKFLNEAEIIDAVSDAISSVMHDEASIPDAVSAFAARPFTSPVNDPPSAPAATEQLGIRDFLAVKPQQSIPKKHTADTKETVRKSITIDEPAVKLFDFDSLDVKGYIFDAYVIAQAGESIYVMDQHAAHERILYEKLVSAYNMGRHLAQPILTPFTIEVTPDLYNSDIGYIEPLRDMGYDISDFGANTYIVRGIPAYMTLDEASSFANGFIDGAEPGVSGRNQTVIDKLIMRSCKGAVKANDRLSEREISDLIQSLSKCRNPFSCPHGRPTFIKITKYEVERAFKRK